MSTPNRPEDPAPPSLGTTAHMIYTIPRRHELRGMQGDQQWPEGSA